MLRIDPSKIGEVTLSLFVEHQMYSQTFSSAPQGILGHIVRFLNQYQIRPDQLRGIEVSMNGGTFTGVRTATTIANMFHLAFGTRLSGEDRYLSASYTGEPRL